MAPVKKSKSAKNSESINSRLQLVCKSGKVGLVFGHIGWAWMIWGWDVFWRLEREDGDL